MRRLIDEYGTTYTVEDEVLDTPATGSRQNASMTWPPDRRTTCPPTSSTTNRPRPLFRPCRNAPPRTQEKPSRSSLRNARSTSKTKSGSRS